MNPIEFRDIAYTLAVSKECSFSRAAEKYYISQPSLSKAVRKVEQQLGITVFDRSSVPLKQTPDGEAVMSYFQKIQDIQQELQDFCEHRKREGGCAFRIGAPSFFCTYLLPPIVADFQLAYPNHSVKLIESNDHDLCEYLRMGAIDIALTVESEMLREFQSFTLQYEDLILAVPKQFRVNENLQDRAIRYEDIYGERIHLPSVPSVPLEKFRQEKFLFLKKGNDMYSRGYKVCRDAGFEPNIVMELDQMLTAYYLAEAGRGVAFVRAGIPYYAGESDRLYLYKLDNPEMRRKIQVFYGSRPQNSEGQDLFIRFLQNYPLPD